jgi:hypothetical protein
LNEPARTVTFSKNEIVQPIGCTGSPINLATGEPQRSAKQNGDRQRDARGKEMIERVVKKLDLKRDSAIKEDLAYWLSKTPQERIAAIEFLRRQCHGSSARLQRSDRVVQQTQGGYRF